MVRRIGKNCIQRRVKVKIIIFFVELYSSRSVTFCSLLIISSLKFHVKKSEDIFLNTLANVQNFPNVTRVESQYYHRRETRHKLTFHMLTTRVPDILDKLSKTSVTSLVSIRSLVSILKILYFPDMKRRIVL